jgi:hypothetical protein
LATAKNFCVTAQLQWLTGYKKPTDTGKLPGPSQQVNQHKGGLPRALGASTKVPCCPQWHPGYGLLIVASCHSLMQKDFYRRGPDHRAGARVGFLDVCCKSPRVDVLSEWAANPGKALAKNVRIDLGSSQIRVSEQILNGANIGSAFQ